MLEKNDNIENRIIAAAESNTAFKRDDGIASPTSNPNSFSGVRSIAVTLNFSY